ncbi:OmpL47-type beta-barrel domain-containing protein [Streptomyces megasporus]|uniref:OmpL47-type beta-barrel domain-containing protein n=1 Tax=Streptomyces megasporus TaxID=44060 RepID=UPI0004E17482|nr:family 16 glycoside hydrolase [Streptomyces megasporus]
MTALLTVLGLTSPAAHGRPAPNSGAAAEQVLTWTAGDDITRYTSAPTTAVAGKATIVFENSEATGNTTAMPHTLTFDVSDPEYNNDVPLNILANPLDANGGRHTAEVTLTPGRYRYHCTIPGHGEMEGVLTVTDGGSGEDTTAPETSAGVSGERDDSGAYLGMATVTVTASDTGSGVERIEYAIGEGEFEPYTAPVMVHEVGTHTVRYRATDRAGNTSAVKSVEFTVVAPRTDDTTAPETSAGVTGEKNVNGEYVGRAKVTVTASDTGSGVERIEYSLDGGPYLAYTAPVTIDRPGHHTVAYRATDKAGNTSEAKRVTFTVVEGGGVPAPPCPEWDERRTVVVGTVDTGVPNRVTGNRCTINELIEDERDWASHALFRKHVREVADDLLDEGVIDKREHRAITEAAKRSGIGEPGRNQGYRDLFDGTRKSFEKWRHVGGGAFGLNDDGTITSSTTVPGMGMLWFPERRYDDFSLKLRFRDDAPGTGRANSGVFVRFPHVHDHPEESRPEWVAITYGHEVQILDRPDGDQYKTGSIYGFDRVGLGGAGVTEKGTWNEYEIRVVGLHYSVFRNGVLINEFDNVGGQEFSPPRAGDPGTDGRRYASGYIGLQTHGTTDVISFRDIRVKEL